MSRFELSRGELLAAGTGVRSIGWCRSLDAGARRPCGQRNAMVRAFDALQHLLRASVADSPDRRSVSPGQTSSSRSPHLNDCGDRTWYVPSTEMPLAGPSRAPCALFNPRFQ